MKLRFRKNSLRLRLNQREVALLARGVSLQEEVQFPGNATFSYILELTAEPIPAASFNNGAIRVLAPEALVEGWAAGDELGLYFDLPASEPALRVAIEKDLDCVEGPADERDPEAFPRTGKNC